MKSRVHPMFSDILRGAFQAPPETNDELSAAIDTVRVLRARLEAQKMILESIAPSDLSSEEEGTYGMSIPQSVVIEAISSLIDQDRHHWANILESKFQAWVQIERDETDISSWEDQ